MTEQNEVKHGMCIAVLPKKVIYQPFGLIKQEIAKLIEPFGPVPKRGPKKFIAQDVTALVSDMCFDFVRRIVDFKDKQAVRSAIHGWCGQNNVELVEPERAKDFDSSWIPGLYAFVSDSGISHVFEVKARTPKLEGWQIGGYWAGSLRLRPDILGCETYGQPIYTEPWCSSESAIKIAANTDIALSQDVDWSWPHTEGPKISLVKELKSRFKQNDLQAKHQLPYALLVHTNKSMELLTKDDWQTSGVMLFKNVRTPKSWDKFVEQFYKRMENHPDTMTCVLDLKIKNE